MEDYFARVLVINWDVDIDVVIETRFDTATRWKWRKILLVSDQSNISIKYIRVYSEKY